MINFSRFNTLAVAVAAVVLISTSSFAEDQVEKPFTISGTGTALTGLPLPPIFTGGAEDVREIVSDGNADFLGLYSGSGNLITASINPLTFSGTFGSGDQNFTFTGANGDKLVCTFGRNGNDVVGEYILTPVGGTEQNPIVTAFFDAVFVPVPEACTGKFKGVTGSWRMFASTESFHLFSTASVAYSWNGEGSLIFKKKEKK